MRNIEEDDMQITLTNSELVDAVGLLLAKNGIEAPDVLVTFVATRGKGAGIVTTIAIGESGKSPTPPANVQNSDIKTEITAKVAETAKETNTMLESAEDTLGAPVVITTEEEASPGGEKDDEALPEDGEEAPESDDTADCGVGVGEEDPDKKLFG
jgi:hypothetical protein